MFLLHLVMLTALLGMQGSFCADAKQAFLAASQLRRTLNTLPRQAQSH